MPDGDMFEICENFHLVWLSERVNDRPGSRDAYASKNVNVSLIKGWLCFDCHFTSLAMLIICFPFTFKFYDWGVPEINPRLPKICMIYAKDKLKVSEICSARLQYEIFDMSDMCLIYS